MRNATLTVTIADPAHHRLLRWLAFRCFYLGGRLLAVGRIELVDLSDDVTRER